MVMIIAVVVMTKALTMMKRLSCPTNIRQPFSKSIPSLSPHYPLSLLEAREWRKEEKPVHVLRL